MAVCKRTAKRRGQEEARARCISNVGSWMRQVRRALMSSVRVQIGIQSVGPLGCAVTAVEDDVEVGAHDLPRVSTAPGVSSAKGVPSN
ncbi:hypothetical protein XPA_009994 [Xanthoria parietina]